MITYFSMLFLESVPFLVKFQKKSLLRQNFSKNCQNLVILTKNDVKMLFVSTIIAMYTKTIKKLNLASEFEKKLKI